jgi:hypothetical protein
MPFACRLAHLPKIECSFRDKAIVDTSRPWCMEQAAAGNKGETGGLVGYMLCSGVGQCRHSFL